MKRPPFSRPPFFRPLISRQLGLAVFLAMAIVLPLVLAPSLGRWLVPDFAARSPGSSGNIQGVLTTTTPTTPTTPTLAVTAVPTTTGTLVPITATITVTATAGASATIGPPPTPVLTPTVALTATLSPLGTPTATDIAMGTATATATAAPTAVADSVFLPWGTRRAPQPWLQTRIWGTQFAMEADPARHASNVTHELPRARAAGLRSIRTHIAWTELEPEDRTPATYAWHETDRRLADYSAAGFDLIVSVIDYPAWAMTYRCGYGYRDAAGREAWREFARAVAQRYGRPPFNVIAWEIGNEVDAKTTVRAEDHERPPAWGQGQPTVPTGGCWGDRPAEYLDFLAVAAEEIRAVHPGALITLGNLAFTDILGSFHRDFLPRFLALGGGKHIDYLGYHWFPDLRELGFPGEPSGIEKARELRAILKAHGLDMPLWLTETYRLTIEGQPESRLGQARFLMREMPELLANSEIERVYWYGWVDFPDQLAGYRQRGIVDAAHRPKPAFPLLSIAARYTDGRGWDVSTDDVIAYRFQPQGQSWTATFAWSRDGRPAKLEVPAWGQSARVLRVDEAALAAGRCCPEERISSSRGRYVIEVDGRSTFIGPVNE